LSEFQNPQNNRPGMDKNVVIVFVFTMVLLLLAQQFLVKPKKQSAQQENNASAPAATQGAAAPATAASAVQPTATQSAAQAVAASSESPTVIENDLYRITFSNRGGLVKSWILKKYNDDKGQPLELVNQQAAAQYGFPLSLWSWDQGLRDKLNGALYVANETSGENGSKTV
jgi:YidC/Oxa1 family membrane protein insertase